MKLKQNCIYVPNPIFENRRNLQQNLADCFELFQNNTKTQSRSTELFTDITNKLNVTQMENKQQSNTEEDDQSKFNKKKKYSPRKVKKRAIFQFDFDEDSIINQIETLDQVQIQKVKNNDETDNKNEKIHIEKKINFYQKQPMVKRFNFLHNQLNFSSSDEENQQKIHSQKINQQQLGIIFPKLKPKIISGFSDDQQKTQQLQKEQQNRSDEKLSSDSIQNNMKQSTQSQKRSEESNKKSSKSTTYINTTQFRRQFVQKHEQYLKIPLPADKSIQLVLKRDKSKTKSQYVEYHIFDAKNFKQILTVKKSENYQIFARSNIQNPKANPHQIYHTATLQTNFFGNIFNLYYPPKTSGLKNQEISATITYETNILGINGPRKMNFYLSKTPLILGSRNLQELYAQNSQKKEICVQKYVNKQAKWNTNVKSYVLNLKGRAKLSSVKNFVIVKEEQENKSDKSVQLAQKNFAIFGKIGKDTFNLVISSPFSILQGVAAGLSTFQRKLICE